MSVPVPIGAVEVLRVMNAFAPYGPTIDYGEISTAISEAATSDPLFPGRADGCARTAAILLAVAFHGSGMKKDLLAHGGMAFGLYGIRPPPTTSDGKPIMANMLLVPRPASYVAIDLIRASLTSSAADAWEARLARFVAGPRAPEPTTADVKKSFEMMVTADDLMQTHLSPKDAPMLPPPEAGEEQKQYRIGA